MKLTFLYHPVDDLKEALAFYRDVLGWDEAWRMGDATVAMQIPGSDVQVMLDVGEAEQARPASGFYEIDDVDQFYEANRDHVTFVEPPQDLAPIRYAAFTDPAGNLFRVFHNLEDEAVDQ